jgi:3'-phosphoadenosine 5'-phosphosulfate sulfotransferase
MSEIFSLVFVMFVGVAIGWYAREQVAVNKIESLREEIKQNVQANSMRIRLEKEKEVLYAYDFDTDKFLGQGESFTALDEILAEKFPGKTFVVSDENLDEVGIKL